MDLGRAFRFVFDDDDWLKVILIGGLLTLIPIVGQILLVGFMIETARNVYRGDPRPLPKWDNFGDKLSEGFKGFVIQLVYSLPIILLSFVFVCVFSAIGASADTTSGQDAAGGIIGVVSLFCFVPLIFVLALVIQPLIFAAQARYIQTNSLGSAFQFGAVIAMVRGNLGPWLMLWLVSILCGFVAGLGSIVLGFGVLFTAAYAQMVLGHALGQTITRTAGGTNSYGTPQPPMSYDPPPTYS